MNTGIVCMSPNFQRDATICHYWNQTGNSSRLLSLCLLLLQNSYLTDLWNHLNNGRRLLLQTFHFRLSLVNHLGKLSWCCWHSYHTWKIDLPLTFLWFSSISCEPSVTALAEDWVIANTFATNTSWPFCGIWFYWRIVFGAYKLCFIDVDLEPFCLDIIFPDCELLFQVL